MWNTRNTGRSLCSPDYCWGSCWALRIIRFTEMYSGTRLSRLIGIGQYRDWRLWHTVCMALHI